MVDMFDAKPFRLMPWQEQIVRDIFGIVVEDAGSPGGSYRQFRTAYVEVGKKQGFQLTDSEKKWFKTASEAERVAFVMDMVSESVGGMNEALAQTDAGKMAALNTVMDNTKIAVGTMANEFKAQIMGQMLPSISSLSDAFLGVLHGEGSVEDLADSFNGVFGEIVNIIETFLPKLLELGSQILTGIVTGIANNMDSLRSYLHV